MKDLWNERREPEPFRIDCVTSIAQPSVELPMNSVWSLEKWISEFASSIQVLAGRFEHESKNDRVLSWDKVGNASWFRFASTFQDDDICLRFVAACANIRAHVFHIPGKSLFDVKSMAGNMYVPVLSVETFDNCIFQYSCNRNLECNHSWLDDRRNVQGRQRTRRQISIGKPIIDCCTGS